MNSIAHLKRSISILESAAKAALKRGDLEYASEALKLRFDYEKKIEAITDRAFIKMNKKG